MCQYANPDESGQLVPTCQEVVPMRLMIDWETRGLGKKGVCKISNPKSYI